MITVALLGNPNTGKTTLFNALSGLRQRVGNYPGVTVELKKGTVTHGEQTFELIDLPGTYSLAPRSPDEMIAVDLLLGLRPEEPRPDVIISIVDAANLDRHLYLTTQAMEVGRPVVVALNMIDLAQKQNIQINPATLAERLGVPVVPIQANKGVGLDALKQAIADAAAGRAAPVPPKFPEVFEAEVRGLAAALDGADPFLVRRLLLDVGGYTEVRLTQRYGPKLAELVQQARRRLAEAGHAIAAIEARVRYGWIRAALADALTLPPTRVASWSDRLDRILTHKLWGTLIFLLIMFVVFQLIFTGAKPISDLIDSGKDALVEALRGVLPVGPLTSLLTSGVIEGVGAVLVFLPQILILFGFIAILEDCGYMARAAFLMDRLMSRCGLNGKSFIPLLSSVACAVPGILATRVIENPRDRLATILVAPLMSCSARLPVYILLIGTFLSDPPWLAGLVMFSMYLIGFVTAPLVALILKRTLLRGETPVFVLEMPAYRIPTLGGVVRRMVDAAGSFIYRAGTIILAAMVLIWALLYFPNGPRYEPQVALLRETVKQLETQKQEFEQAGEQVPDDLHEQLERAEQQANELEAEWKGQSYLARAGKSIAPVFAPLGWDWKITVAALASFPAREVVVGTLGILYARGETDAGEVADAGTQAAGSTPLGEAIRQEWSADSQRAGLCVPIALSLMVFFALCCQCASTLAVIRRETKTWRWPAFTFIYMTALAYVAALVVFQVGRCLV
jgi:ferrous iron transport protein B